MTRAERNIAWIEARLRVPEGRFVSEPIVLRPFQRKILTGIYDGNTRRAIITLPRKNAKTSIAAMLLLLHLAGPEYRLNAQLYSDALSKEQAALLYKLAAKMVRMSEELEAHIICRDHTKELHCPELGTLYQALSAEASTAFGRSPVFAVHDELGQVKGPRSELYEAIETGMGAHDDPLSIIISTQAPTDADLLSILIDDALTGADPKTKLFLWTAPDDADPFAPETWRAANPALPDLLNEEVIRDLAEAARRMPSREAAFRNLNLNQRISQTAPLISRARWEACKGKPDVAVLRDPKRKVYGGLDLSARNDLCALAYIVEDDDGNWHAFVDYFTPEDGLVDRARRDRVPYDLWVDEGLIIATPGASVDYEYIAKHLVELCEDSTVSIIAYDRWRIDVLQKELERIGAGDLPLQPFGQGFKDMSPAIDELEAAIVGRKLLHGGHPVLRWNVASAKATTDPAGNRKLDKSKSTARIDGLVALAMAFGVKHQDPNQGPSVYEERGLREVDW